MCIRDRAYVTLNIYVDVAGEKTSRFGVWDASTGLTHELSLELELSAGATIGVPEQVVLDFVGAEEPAENQAPVVVLKGESSVTVEAGQAYEEAGASASDAEDGDLSGSIAISGEVNVDQPGSYTVSYVVVDSKGASSAVVTRTVTVEDTTAPVITLTGDASVTIELGTVYTDAGATSDGGETVTTTGTVDVITAGVYTLTYSASDASGNPAVTVSRTVIVAKTTVVQTLELKAGWNLVSFYVVTDDMATATVLGPIHDKLEQIKSLTKSYDPNLPFFLNTLTSLNVTDGYWLRVSENINLEIEGVVPAGATIPVKT